MELEYYFFHIYICSLSTYILANYMLFKTILLTAELRVVFPLVEFLRCLVLIHLIITRRYLSTGVLPVAGYRKAHYRSFTPSEYTAY